MSLYILTNKNDGTQEGSVVKNATAYKQIETAPFLNPFFDDIINPDAWECTIPNNTTVRDEGVRLHCSELKIIKKVPITQPTTTQTQKFALICGISAYNNPNFIQWANAWLNNENRSQKTAKEISDNIQVDCMEVGQNVAFAALATITGSEYQEYNQKPEYYAAATGWQCYTSSQGKIDLIPAAQFALQGN